MIYLILLWGLSRLFILIAYSIISYFVIYGLNMLGCHLHFTLYEYLIENIH